MIKKLPQSNGNNLVYEITAKVSNEDEKVWNVNLLMCMFLLKL